MFLKPFFTRTLLTTGLLLSMSSTAVFAAPASKIPSLDQNQVELLKKQVIGYASSLQKVQAQVQNKDFGISPENIKDLAEKPTTPEEKELLNLWAKMVNEKSLRPSTNQLIELLKTDSSPFADTIKALPPEQLAYLKEQLIGSIEALVALRGLTTETSSAVYTEWNDLSKLMLKKIDHLPKGKESILGLAKSNWFSTESAEVLVDGEASFAKRDVLMQNAKSSIHILTWSIYDDLTGTQLVDLLIAKKKENKDLDIKIMVDGQVAALPGHGDQVKRLIDNHIDVVLWFSKQFPFAGQHRKMLIVDDEHLIAGGLNFGDVYSHKNPDSKVPKWRDTDIYLKGDGAVQGNQLFAQIWNEQVAQYHLPLEKINISPKTPNKNQGISVAIINHDPQVDTEGSPIMLTLLKAIRESEVKIDIENAYIILFPALKKEISDAIARGVKVRIFTNSGESVDEPIVNVPILRSAKQFAAMGTHVYLKKGATLHSKIVAIDDEFSFIMSYNLHPRSEKVEGEMAIAVKDVEFTKGLHRLFDQDVTPDKASAIQSADEIELSKSPAALPSLRLFFDLL